MQLARQKLGKKTHPNHGGCHCPTVAMVPSSWHHHIQQLANMLCDKSVVKTRKYYCFYYLLAIFRHDASSTHRQGAVPVCFRVVSVGGTESIILSAGGIVPTKFVLAERELEEPF
jgi:hypothetical protein